MYGGGYEGKAYRSSYALPALIMRKNIFAYDSVGRLSFGDS